MSEDFDPDALAEIYDIDIETYIEVIDCYLEDTPSIMNEINETVNNDDAQTLRERAHKIKGSSSTMGLSKVSSIAFELETLGRNGKTDGASELFQQLSEAVENAFTWLKEQKTKAAAS